MTTVPPLWRRARDVFDEVASLPPAGRVERLHSLCGDDAALRAEVESLLSHDAAAGEPIAEALQRAARELTNEVWLTPGAAVLHYDIVAHVGAGAMGDVWRAVDRSLGRVVAIKVLPSAVTHDPVWLARFEREARVLATLNHANIASIYSVHAVEGHRILAMEFADGEDLSTRLMRGAIPLDEALPIAKQIAEALEAAHGQGIIHRDLKPANIRVRTDGTVKVLDFGLAKALDRSGELSEAGKAGGAVGVNRPNLAVLPDRPDRPGHPGLPAALESPAHLTDVAAILGTAAYMAPEQAKGRAVDQRADIWAFGAVLFEMLTGRRAFPGENVTDTLVSVINQEPDWTALPKATPVGLRRLLTRCLKKDVKSRLQAIGDARVQLDELLSGAPEDASGTATVDAPASATRGRLPWIAAVTAFGALAIAFALPAVRGVRERPPLVRPEMRVEITTPATADPLQFAVSPDGRSLVFVASGEGTSRLWLRPLGQTEARPLAGTEGATAPFWSPDSRAIGFFAGTNLLLLDISHGAPRMLATTFGAGNGSSASWSADGTILFSREFLGPLWRVAATGGEPSVVTRLDPSHHVGHRAPHFLPDGRHFLFYVAGTPDAAGIYLGSLDSDTISRLTAADSGGAFLPPDHVVFVQQETLVARRLDLTAGVLSGDPVTLAERVRVDENSATGGFAVSGAGLVAYRAGVVVSRQLEWVDRAGKVVGVAGDPDPNTLRYPALSADGRHVAMGRTVQGNIDAWLLDLVRGGRTRLTFDAAVDTFPIWSPDGGRIAFASNRGGVYHIYLKPSNGSSAEEELVDSPISMVPQSWSPDGRWLVFYTLSPDTGRDLEAIDLTSLDRTRRIVAKTRAEEVLAELSPDGRWVAYQTNESGRFEVVVQSFPDVGGKWQISTAGGVAPRWRADGKELYFLAPDATMMAAPIGAAGASFEAGTPVPLFRTRIVEAGSAAATRPQYSVARDGRFLINRAVADTTAAPITLILEWQGGLSRDEQR